jgi:hypothetical protein
MNARSIVTLAVLVGSLGIAAAPASAQYYDRYQTPPPRYDRWQAAWDRYEYDRAHVVLGTVANFQPFRLSVARHDGVVQTIDLKHGTIILPTGATPSNTQRVAVVGYYSKGTFIANRVILRN